MSDDYDLDAEERGLPQCIYLPDPETGEPVCQRHGLGCLPKEDI